MSILLLGISHKDAPLSVREAFAYAGDERERVLNRILTEGAAREAVLLCTCNRTELYAYTGEDGTEREAFLALQQILTDAAKREEKKALSGYFRFYQGEKAVSHLFSVVSGLDSMVMGEDQILGQVKEAQEYSMERGYSGTYLNTLFRYAVTAAKKVKTETNLSKTPVSTASLAVHAAREVFPDLSQRRILVIGASGKIGSIVVKNLISMGCGQIYVTVRSHTKLPAKAQEVCTCIPYEDRYRYAGEMDVIVSATASPHYTLTAARLEECLDERRRVFLDLAVPMDIEYDRTAFGQAVYYNIDDFSRTARENNRKKEKEASAAGMILGEYEADFGRWYVFQKNLGVMEAARELFLREAEVKGPGKAFDRLMYRIREENSPRELEHFFACMEEIGKDKE